MATNKVEIGQEYYYGKEGKIYTCYRISPDLISAYFKDEDGMPYQFYLEDVYKNMFHNDTKK